LRSKRNTARCLRVFQLLNRGEVAVDERRIGERPQMLGGLEFLGVRRQNVQVEMVRHVQTLGAMPAGTI
jgi:hypothetical protein